MKNVTIKIVFFMTSLFWGVNASATVILSGMMDDFEDGTTHSWVKGHLSSYEFAPKNLANEDESNRFLQVKSFGQGLGVDKYSPDPNSRMVFFNQNQWAGDYSNISSISLSLRAESVSEEYLYMRLAIFDTGESGTYSRYVSSESQQLKADGGWYHVSLSLLAEDLTRFRGEESVTNVLTNISELRILSSKDDAKAWDVDKIAATLSIDDITAVYTPQVLAAVPVPAAIWFMISGLLGLFGMSLKRTV